MHDPERPAHSRTYLDRLPPRLAQRVAAELTERERLLWAGQPRPDLFARPATGGFVMGILFLVFGALIVAMAFAFGFLGGASATGTGNPLGDALVGGLCTAGFCGFPAVVFVPLGVWLVTGPARMRRQARGTAYALTDARAVVLASGPGGTLTVRSYRPDQLAALVREENPDGSGSLIFQEEMYVVRYRRRSRTSVRRYGFLAIDGVARVEALIRDRVLSAG
jgi:hypothetical protein